jgi:hypothetical protein
MLLIKKPLIKLLKKYPEVKFIMWGADYSWVYEGLPKEQIEILPWLDYRVYKMRLSTLGHDIALAPLRETVFNSCRSGIKWYESSAVWRPAATLASRAGAFKNEMEDGKTGLLFSDEDEFETKLEALILDSTLRTYLSTNAKDWVRTNRDPAIHVQKLYEKYAETREARLNWPDPEVTNDISTTDKPNVRRRKKQSRRVFGKRVSKRPANKGGKKRPSSNKNVERRRKLEVAENDLGLLDSGGNGYVRVTAAP